MEHAQKPQQYDLIGARFRESKTTAAFSAADTHTLFEALGDVSGRTALDLACGFGYNTRLLAQRGAGRAVGVDISAEMIRLAREEEARAPLGIEYHVADAAALPRLGRFDLATAVYLFNYAPSRAALRSMCAGAHANLAPGGRLYAIVPNPAPFPGRNWDAFGVGVVERVPVPGGEAPRLRARFLTDPPTPFEFYEWQLADVQQAAVDAGFKDVVCRTTHTPPPDARRDAAFWRSYDETPVSSLLICTAP